MAVTTNNNSNKKIIQDIYLTFKYLLEDKYSDKRNIRNAAEVYCTALNVTLNVDIATSLILTSTEFVNSEIISCILDDYRSSRQCINDGDSLKLLKIGSQSNLIVVDSMRHYATWMLVSTMRFDLRWLFDELPLRIADPNLSLYGNTPLDSCRSRFHSCFSVQSPRDISLSTAILQALQQYFYGLQICFTEYCITKRRISQQQQQLQSSELESVSMFKILTEASQSMEEWIVSLFNSDPIDYLKAFHFAQVRI
jgi:hypothetical protein